MKSTASGRMPLLVRASQQCSGSLLYHPCFVQGETDLGGKTSHVKSREEEHGPLRELQEDTTQCFPSSIYS